MSVFSWFSALILFSVASIAFAQEPFSPRLQALLDSPNRQSSLAQFWAEHNGPLVEPLDGQNILITLLWRDDDKRIPVRVIWPAPPFNTQAFQRLADTDIFYLSTVVPQGAKVSYQLARPQGITEQSSREDLRVGLWQSAFADPLNPQQRVLGGGAGAISLIDLSTDKAKQASHVAAGTVITHTLDPIDFAKQRQVHVYNPAGFSASDALPMLVLFDGERFHQQLAFERHLDQAIADGLPALRVLFVDNPSREHRQHDLTCNTAFSSALANDWLPTIARQYATTSRFVAGASFGGLASLCMALEQPQVIDGVVSLSGSFWWKERALLERVQQRRLTQPIYLAAGLMESASDDGILGSNRALEKILRKQGVQVHLHEYAGGHDYWVWQDQLIRALGVMLSH